jgi:ABC-type transporter Mla subunit MlaD
MNHSFASWKGLISSLILLLVLGSSFMALTLQRKGIFDSRVRYVLKTDTAQDLHIGMKLTYRGFTLGHLKSLALKPDGKIQAEIEINQDMSSFITEGVSIRLTKDKLVTSELILEQLDPTAKPLAPGKEIALSREHLTADVAKKIDALLGKVDTLLGTLADSRHGLPALLNQTQATLATLQPVSKQAVLTLAELEKSLAQLQPISQQAISTLSELEKSVVQSRGSVEQTQILLKQLADPNTGLSSAVQQTRLTTEKAGNLIENIDSTVKDVKSAPLYRWLVPSRKKTDTP